MLLKFLLAKTFKRGGLLAPLLFFTFVWSIRGSATVVENVVTSSQQHSDEFFSANGSSSEWKRILFYQKSIFGFESGMVDSPNFYIASRGHRDPVAELKATYVAMVTAGYRVPGFDVPAACAFPARLDFLLRKGLLTLAEVPEHHCPDVERWLSERTYNSMWLVFSSWYPANPASMYGHTFLRFRRADRESDLLDDAVNFAAQVESMNGFLYPIKGLMGGFMGRFSMMPYHLKINEYNNIESRDLWEYRISANPEQIRRVILSLLEVGPHAFQYFYLDENCSWVILKALETGDPAWNFMPDFKFWVVPIDTVRWAVRDRGNEVIQMSRLSMQNKFSQRYGLLNEASRKQFIKIIKKVDDVEQRGSEPLAVTDVTGNISENIEKRRLVDALLDWVDYQDAAGTETKPGVAQLRKTLFKLRASISGEPDQLENLPESQNPLNGHGTTHVRVGAVRQPDGKNYPTFSWTPALHELLAPISGYAQGLEIAMFRMGGWWDKNNHSLVVNDLGLVSIRALSPWNETKKAASWFVGLDYTTDKVCPSHPRGCQKSRVEVGRGLTLAVPVAPSVSDLYAAAFIQGESGLVRRRDDQDRLFLGLGPRLDFWYGGDFLRLEYWLSGVRSIDSHGNLVTEWQQHAGIGISVTPSSDIRFSWNRNGLSSADGVQSGQFYSIMGGYYF